MTPAPPRKHVTFAPEDGGYPRVDPVFRLSLFRLYEEWRERWEPSDDRLLAPTRERRLP